MNKTKTNNDKIATGKPRGGGAGRGNDWSNRLRKSSIREQYIRKPSWHFRHVGIWNPQPTQTRAGRPSTGRRILLP